MKKIWLFFLFCFSFPILTSCHQKKENELETFLRMNHLTTEDIASYLPFKRFDVHDFFALEELREKNNYTYLETINYYYLSNIQPAALPSSYLTLVNKHFYLDKEATPLLVSLQEYPILCTKKDIMIQKQVLIAYLEMIDTLELSRLYVFSGFRDYMRQEEIYEHATHPDYCALPGFSEHQTGLCLDLSTLEHGLTDHFAYTKEYQLLINHAFEFGFILRYPKGKENITGYPYEPWHFRYVGKNIAGDIMKNDLTLEEYLFSNFEL